jgi:hypothetical protein
LQQPHGVTSQEILHRLVVLDDRMLVKMLFYPTGMRLKRLGENDQDK